jgi:hypothetical protein
MGYTSQLAGIQCPTQPILASHPNGGNIHQMLVATLALTMSGATIAKGGHGRDTHMPSYGTGAKAEHSHVHDYVKKRWHLRRPA